MHIFLSPLPTQALHYGTSLTEIWTLDNSSSVKSFDVFVFVSVSLVSPYLPQQLPLPQFFDHLEGHQQSR